MALVLLTHSLLRRDITGRRRANAELKRANEDLHDGLRAAAQVQASLLPRPDIFVPGLRFAWAFQPCEELAGDAFDICPLGDGQVGFYLLDVSGHSAAAALLAVSVIQALAPHAGRGGLALGVGGPVEPADVAGELDRRFPLDDDTGRFFTILYGVVDTQRRTFRYSSAGHPSPAQVATQRPAALLELSAGLPIGLGGEYAQTAVSLATRDRVYLYSDGVTEAMNADGELFGSRRLVAALERGRELDLQESVDLVLSDLRHWRGEMRPLDDVSVVALEAAPTT